VVQHPRRCWQGPGVGEAINIAIQPGHEVALIVWGQGNRANHSGYYAHLVREPSTVGSKLEIADSERRIIRPTPLVVCTRFTNSERRDQSRSGQENRLPVVPTGTRLC
jgi:hypothetical protein